jgi:hypothetical protein
MLDNGGRQSVTKPSRDDGYSANRPCPPTMNRPFSLDALSHDADPPR